ncbi:MAG: hypothetical protein KDA93_18980 [Planctomycetaceae bacterium]|nr:hypothetical protein [Planctomycetaceae bacterium]
MFVSIRKGLLMGLLAMMPASVDAGLFAPFCCDGCGPRPWIGFSFALPLLTPCDFGLCCRPRYDGCYPNYGGCYSGCGPAYPAPLSYGCGVTPGCGDCGTNIAPPITTVPSIQPTAPLLPPATPGPAFPETGYLPNPCAQPVCQTTLQPQQFTTYQNVPTTQYRREAYTEHVPVTTYQPQVRYRDVAYTVNRPVAQTFTQYVPQTHVSYAPQYPVASAPCSTCNQGTAYGLTPQFAAPGMYSSTIGGIPVYESPTMSAGVPTPIALPQSAEASQVPAATLQPPQQTSSSQENWQSIPQRHAQAETSVQQMGHWMPQAEPRRLPIHRSIFQPAPSAATVWQSPWLR